MEVKNRETKGLEERRKEDRSIPCLLLSGQFIFSPAWTPDHTWVSENDVSFDTRHQMFFIVHFRCVCYSHYLNNPLKLKFVQLSLISSMDQFQTYECKLPHFTFYFYL